MAHHCSGTTPTFDEMATEGEAQSISRYTFEGPLSTIAPHEGPVNSPEEQSFIHSSGDQCIGGRPRFCSLGQFASGVAWGEGDFFTIDTCANRIREESRCTRGRSTSQSLSFAGRIGCVGGRQPRRRTFEGISRDCQAAMSRATHGRTSGFLFEGARGRIKRQKKIVEEAQQLLTKCESQLATRLQDLERTFDRNHRVAQLRRERNEWLAKPNSQFTEDVGDFFSFFF